MFSAAGEVLGKEYIFDEGNSVKVILLPSVKGSTLKGKNLLGSGANSSLVRAGPFQKRRDLVCRKANRKSQKLSPL